MELQIGVARRCEHALDHRRQCCAGHQVRGPHDPGIVERTSIDGVGGLEGEGGWLVPVVHQQHVLADGGVSQAHPAGEAWVAGGGEAGCQMGIELFRGQGEERCEWVDRQGFDLKANGGVSGRDTDLGDLVR